MKQIDTITFTSPINIDNGYINTPQGEHQSEMTLLHYGGDGYSIEWDNPIDVVLIGIEVEENTKAVTGYDGVFELPEQAIQLLEKNGFDCKQVKD